MARAKNFGISLFASRRHAKIFLRTFSFSSEDPLKNIWWWGMFGSGCKDFQYFGLLGEMIKQIYIFKRIISRNVDWLLAHTHQNFPRLDITNWTNLHENLCMHFVWISCAIFVHTATSHLALIFTLNNQKVSFSPLFCSFILSPLWNYSTPFRPLTQYVDRPIHTNILARNFKLFYLLKFKIIRALWVTFVNSGHKFESKKKFQ